MNFNPLWFRMVGGQNSPCCCKRVGVLEISRVGLLELLVDGSSACWKVMRTPLPTETREAVVAMSWQRTLHYKWNKCSCTIVQKCAITPSSHRRGGVHKDSRDPRFGGTTGPILDNGMDHQGSSYQDSACQISTHTHTHTHKERTFKLVAIHLYVLIDPSSDMESKGILLIRPNI